MSIGMILVLSLFGAGGFLFILRAMLQTGNAFKSLVVSSLQGIGVLFALNVAGSFAGISLSVNPFTMIVSAIGGVPGVTLLLLTNFLMQ